ncbi:MAG: 4Fe-4S dicluster domain-containing protein [Ruminococcaceae bacterium]|nr:4Fe-4S dicluster domain-containing protein [Oscillospiraceae bacterium]
MRGSNTEIAVLRREIFKEVVRVAYDSEDTTMRRDLEEIPYKLSPDDNPKYRESIYRERAIASERIRLAMGMSLRPNDKPVYATSGLSKSNISDKYYEPPLMQVIPSACEACEENIYKVSDQCRGCIAHPCVSVCPVGAVSMVNGRSVIDQEKCIKCGKCKKECPYDAIVHRERPCAKSCGVRAIKSDKLGRAKIDNEICVACGQCMVACPFGAIADKSQLFQLIRAIRAGDYIVAAVAPAIVGQFGADVSLGQIRAGLLELGFKEMHEVAVGADVGVSTEARHYAKEVATGNVPFLLTSCCPSWAMLAEKQFPDIIDKVSNTLTPMVSTARSIKQKNPNARVVFIGPCASKKLEAGKESIRSDVDFVITFEELAAMFDERGVDLKAFEGETFAAEATALGRGYACAGGVSGAIKKCIEEYYPDVEVRMERADGLDECRKMLILAKAGKKNGCLIEGMGCAGGCVAGAGTCIPVNQATRTVEKVAQETPKKMPDKDLFKIELP